MRLATSVRSAVLDAAAFLFPVDCAACGAPGRAVCDRCRAAVRAAVPPVLRQEVGAPLHAGALYDGPPAALLRAVKARGRTDAAGALAPLIARAIAAAVPDCAAPGSVLLVRPPPSTAAARQRGYDPVGLLVDAAGLASVSPLRWVRRPADQALLGAADRRANLAGALVARPPSGTSRAVVVDDVVTTGSTIAEMVRALRASGFDVVAAAAALGVPRTGAASSVLGRSMADRS